MAASSSEKVIEVGRRHPECLRDVLRLPSSLLDFSLQKGTNPLFEGHPLLLGSFA